MLPALVSYVSHHRRKFIFGGLLVGGAFFVSYYGKNRLKFDKASLVRKRKEMHYVEIERICREMAFKMMARVKEVIVKELSCNELIASLRNKTAPDKVAAWKEMQVLSCSKLITFIYATSVLFIFLKIQLNLIGGYNFRDLHDGKAKRDDSIENEYLSLAQHFIKYGVLELCELIKEKIAIVMKNKSLQQEMSITNVRHMFWAINLSILVDQRNPCQSLGRYLLPCKYKEDTFKTKSKFLDQLILDTKDLIEYINVTGITESCVAEGFEFLNEEIKGFFMDWKNKEDKSEKNKKASSKKPKSVGEDEISSADEILNTTIPLAKIIPFIDNFIQKGDNDKSQKWMERLNGGVNMKLMGANVFETFSSEW